jgi:SAM-dependent methyltransferase
MPANEHSQSEQPRPADAANSNGDAFAMPQTWNPERYIANARFVAELGAPVVELMAPIPGERILDVGCGDGFLTAKLAGLGCNVVGVDASAAQVEAARKLGLDARVADAAGLAFASEFDAVFSNATLHWLKDHDAVIDGAWRALKPGGRFVGECGGAGCVALIRAALGRALSRRGLEIDAVNPWNFATAEEFGGRLRKRGFTVESVAVFPRATPLPGDVRAWLETFAENFMKGVPAADRPAFLAEVQEDLRPDLCDGAGKWTADYTRLRFRAVRPAAARA